MASAASPILPTTTTATAAATTTPAFRSFITRLHDQIKDGFSQRRPWSELADRTAFSTPDSLSDATTRIRKNYSYFRVNYLSLIAAVIAFSLIAHPFSLFTLAALLASWCFLYLFRASDQNLILFGREFSDKETLGLLIVFSILAVFLTNIGSVLMSAVVVGVAIVSVHGAFRVTEDLFLDDQDSATGGSNSSFLTFLGPTTKNASASAVANRV